MNKKGLEILMRTRMRRNDTAKLALSPLAVNEMSDSNQGDGTSRSRIQASDGGKEVNLSDNSHRAFERVRGSLHSAVSMTKMEVLDDVLNDFSEGYFSLSREDRRKMLRILAKEYDLDRAQARELIKQYLGLELPQDDEDQSNSIEDGNRLSSFYRIERNLRHMLKPRYEVLFKRLNTHPGGLKFLSNLRADILSVLTVDNTPSMRALDSFLKEKLSTWLSPASLELHQITWDDPASLLEKIVAYEAVHPISNLIDLKRRLGVGRRCFGYLHPAVPGEPLIFIEVALLKNVAQSIQEVLWNDPPVPEDEATCALFYSISSTQPGLAGINLGKFLIKRVVTLIKREMPQISTFATLSPIPGYMQWLLSKLASQSMFAQDKDLSHSSATATATATSSFWENILEPEEEQSLLSLSEDYAAMKNGMEVMLNLLTTTNDEWKDSVETLIVLKPPLMRLCVRYLLQEKKRGKALDSVANFHLQNGAMVGRINWMADRSGNGLHQSAGIMVNYIYRLESIDEYAQSYFSLGHIQASPDISV